MEYRILRKIIREVLMEAEFVPTHKKKEFYNVLSRGIKTGRGEDIKIDKTVTQGIDYFQKAEGGALSYLNDFKSLCNKLKGNGLSDVEKDLLKKRGESINNTHIGSTLGLMFKYAKNANKANEKELRDKIIEDRKGLFKSSYQNLPTNNNMKSDVTKSLMSYEGFLESINSNLVDDVRALINNIH